MTKFQKTMRMTIAAGGLAAMTGTYASAAPIAVGDASFEDHNIDAFDAADDGMQNRPNFAYSADGGGWIDGYSPAAGGSSAWSSDEGGSPASWIYNSEYATATSRSAPRTGDQALAGDRGYTFQVLGETFEANTTYTLSAFGSNTGNAGRMFLYIYNGTEDAIPSDGNRLNAPADHFFALTTDWVEHSVTFTTSADLGDLAGDSIGIGIWTDNAQYVDDVSFDASPVPEPGSLALLGLGGLMIARRRRA